MSRTMPFTANVDNHLRPSLMRVVIDRTSGLDTPPSMYIVQKVKHGRERACFRSPGMGMGVTAAMFLAFGLTPACEIDRPR